MPPKTTRAVGPAAPPIATTPRYWQGPDNCFYEVGPKVTSGHISVTRLVRDVFSGNFYADITWHNQTGSPCSQLVKKGDISDIAKLRQLLSLGAPLLSNHRSTAEFLEHHINLPLETDEAASMIGWKENKFWVPGGTREFVDFSNQASWQPAFGADKEAVKEAIRELISWGVTPAFIMVAASLSSPLVKLLSLARNPIITLSKKSNSGKTTATKFAISLWGNPQPSKTLYLSKATGNGLLSFALERDGLPIALDDTQNKPDAELSDVIYSIAEGGDKARSSVAGKSVINPSLWKGTFMSTGEFSVLTEAMGTGAINRIIEMAEPPLGDCDEEEGKRRIHVLNNISSNHYGACREEIIQLLEQEDAVREAHELIGAMECFGVPSGTEGEIGLVAYGVEMMLKFAGVPDDGIVHDVISYLAGQASTTRTVAKSKERNAYDELVNIAASLERRGELIYSGNEIVGRYHNTGMLPLLSVVPSARIFNPWKLKYGDMNKYYRTWADEGLLRVGEDGKGNPTYTHSVRLTRDSNHPRLPNLILQPEEATW